MPRVIKIARPENYRVELNEDGQPLFVTCEYEGYRYKFTLDKPLTQRAVNRIHADSDKIPPSASQYLVNCFDAAFFGASRTHHIRNIMNNFQGISGVLSWEEIEQGNKETIKQVSKESY